MHSFLATGEYSDLTISCNGKTFKVHKMILHGSSPVFKKLLSGKFKVIQKSNSMSECLLTFDQEAQDKSGVVSLDDDDAEALKSLIHYLYHQVYNDAFLQDKNSMSFAVKVYAIADKYELTGLQRLAAQRFGNICNPNTNLDDFINSVYLIDESTNPNDQALWKIVIPVIKSDISFLLDLKEFNDLLANVNGLTGKVLSLLDPSKAADSHGPPYFARTPPPAGEIVEIDDDDGDAGDDYIPFPRAPLGIGHYGSRGRRLG